MAFGKGKTEKIIGVGKIGKSHSHSTDNAYLVDGLKHNLLSMFQLCDRGNRVMFSSCQCLVLPMSK